MDKTTASDFAKCKENGCSYSETLIDKACADYFREKGSKDVNGIIDEIHRLRKLIHFPKQNREKISSSTASLA